MCGILGLILPSTVSLDGGKLKGMAADLLLMSMERGRDSSGVAVLAGGEIKVLRAPVGADRLVRMPAFGELFGAAAASGLRAVIGHARLMTNGLQGIDVNNQPVCKGDAVAIHNGIVVNDAQLWRNHPEQTRVSEVDTEALLAAIESHRRDKSLKAAVRAAYAEVVGTASIATLFADDGRLLLATNNGSLYFWAGGDVFLFASEARFLESLLAKHPGLATRGRNTVSHLAPGNAMLVDLETLKRETFRLDEREDAPAEDRRRRFAIVDLGRDAERRRRGMRRCTCCILPETMPLISFDEHGVCNFCREYTPMPRYGREALLRLVEPFRSKDGSPDCVVGLSGGRDSCYALHYLKRELGMNPVAYTYDWGLVTDLARRNQARMCGALGVEHVIVAPDIKRKRRNIRDNIEAWFKQPDLGMIPLFMAGDKFYFYHLDQVRRRYGVSLGILGGNRLEKTNFKTGFCGVTNEGAWRLYDVNVGKKLSLAVYYAKQFLSNPSYLNRSLADTAFAYKVSYFGRHDFTWLYDYIGWDEAEIDRTLRDDYAWETAADTDTTWRIGDGTAAFYNYIYHTVAGFSEIDTFRSNQIREGMITRDEAIGMAERENQPRFDSIKEYAHLIGFDFDTAMAVINAMPKLY